jgi:hypothetical protein
MCDRDKFNKNILNRFVKLQHPHKILFISNKWKINKSSKSLTIINVDCENECPDGMTLENLYPIFPSN